MAAKDPRRLKKINTAAANYRWRPNDPAAREALTEIRTESLEQYVREVADAAPPLTPAQRDRIALALRGGAPA